MLCFGVAAWVGIGMRGHGRGRDHARQLGCQRTQQAGRLGQGFHPARHLALQQLARRANGTLGRPGIALRFRHRVDLPIRHPNAHVTCTVICQSALVPC